MTKAIYPGSFDPFTNGHLDICKKASELFDEVCVVIAVNAQKQRTFSSEGMKDAIEQDLLGNGITNCSVYICYGLVAKFAEEIGAKYMIRGLRNNMDYNYEENIAEVNKLINPLMEYVYFRADNVGVSSSMVKELYSYNQDVSGYVPRSTFDTIRNYGEIEKTTRLRSDLEHKEQYGIPETYNSVPTFDDNGDDHILKEMVGEGNA